MALFPTSIMLMAHSNPKTICFCVPSHSIRLTVSAGHFLVRGPCAKYPRYHPENLFSSGTDNPCFLSIQCHSEYLFSSAVLLERLILNKRHPCRILVRLWRLSCLFVDWRRFLSFQAWLHYTTIHRIRMTLNKSPKTTLIFHMLKRQPM